MKVFLCCALAMLAIVAIEAVPVAEESVELEDPALQPQAIVPEDGMVVVLDDGEAAREKRHSRYGGGYGGYGGYRGGYGGYRGGYGGYGRGYGGYGRGFGGYGGYGGGYGGYGGFGHRRFY